MRKPRGMLAPVFRMLVVGVLVGTSVNRPIVMTMFVFVPDMLMGMSVDDSAGMFVLMGVVFARCLRRHVNLYSLYTD